MLCDNSKRSAERLDKDEAPKLTPKPSIHQINVMLLVWYPRAGVFHFNFIKTGQFITADVYCNPLDEIVRGLRINHLKLANNGRSIVLKDDHDNIFLNNVAQYTGARLVNSCPEPYFPDLSSTNYYVSRTLDSFLKKKILYSTHALENIIRDFITACPSVFFNASINTIPLRGQNSTDSLGSYFD